MFEVQTNLMDLQEMHSILNLLSDQLPGAAAAAVGDTLDICRVRVIDELETQFNAPREELAQRVGRSEVERPQRQFIQGKVFLRGRPLSLRLFKPAQHAKGVVYRPYTSGGMRLVPHAFGPEINKLGRGVFRRKGKERKPIEKLPGLKLTDDPVAEAAMEKVAGEMPQILQAQSEKYMGKLLDAINEGRVDAFGRIHVSQQRDAEDGVRYTGF